MSLIEPTNRTADLSALKIRRDARDDRLVVDVVQMPAPAQTPAGSYRLEVGLYDPGTMERLTIDEAGVDKLDIDPLSILE